MQSTVHDILYTWSYPKIVVFTTGYFLGLYTLAPLFEVVCKCLARQGIAEKIEDVPIPKSQIRYEIRHSLVSLLVFGLSSIPLVYGIRAGFIQLRIFSVWNVIWGVVVLFIWNEVYFFVIHRLLHIPFLMKTVHHIHHRSVVPTVYSGFSMHWVEAFLLSNVAFLFACIVALTPLVFILYPLVSFLFNLAGHSNYRIKCFSTKRIFQFGIRHHEHHYKFSKHYGFASSIMDAFYRLIKDKSRTTIFLKDKKHYK